MDNTNEQIDAGYSRPAEGRRAADLKQNGTVPLNVSIAVSVVLFMVGILGVLVAVPMKLVELLSSGKRTWHRHRTDRYWDTFNSPVYVPEHDREVIELLTSGDISQLVVRLEHRASLGSGWASGLLAYLEAVGVLGGTPDLAAAISRCTAAAQAGDSYAQYVLAWALWETGERVRGIRWMRRSATEGKFLPAWAGWGLMLYALAGKDLKARRIALKLLWRAHRRGHIQPLQFICRCACRGHFGMAYRLVGLLAYPFVLSRASLIGSWHPFSERCFMWHSPEVHPILPFFKLKQQGIASPAPDQDTSNDSVAPRYLGRRRITADQANSNRDREPASHGAEKLLTSVR